MTPATRERTNQVENVLHYSEILAAETNPLVEAVPNDAGGINFVALNFVPQGTEIAYTYNSLAEVDAFWMEMEPNCRGT